MICAHCQRGMPDDWRGLAVPLIEGEGQWALCSDECASRVLRERAAVTRWPDGRIFLFSPKYGIYEETLYAAAERTK